MRSVVSGLDPEGIIDTENHNGRRSLFLSARSISELHITVFSELSVDQPFIRVEIESET